MSVENPRLKYLEDVPWEKLLKLSNGKMVHNLEQLPMVIKFSDDEVFDSHVTDQKNDFANWIRDVVGYSELADKILGIRFKEGFIAAIEQGIVDAKNYVAPPAPTPISVVVPVPAVVSTSAVASTPVVTPVIEAVSTPVVAPAPVVASVPVATPIPIVVPVVEAVLTPAVAPVPVAVPTPIVVPAPVVVPVSVASVVPSVVTSSSVPPVVSTPVVPTVSITLAQPEVKPEETYDFEEIFKILLDDLASEIFVWDVPTS